MANIMKEKEFQQLLDDAIGYIRLLSQPNGVLKEVYS